MIVFWVLVWIEFCFFYVGVYGFYVCLWYVTICVGVTWVPQCICRGQKTTQGSRPHLPPSLRLLGQQDSSACRHLPPSLSIFIQSAGLTCQRREQVAIHSLTFSMHAVVPLIYICVCMNICIDIRQCFLLSTSLLIRLPGLQAPGHFPVSTSHFRIIYAQFLVQL